MSSTPHPLLQASSVTNLLPMEHISSFKYRRQDSTVDRPTSAHTAVEDASPTFRLALIENEVSAFLDQQIGPGFAAGTSLPQLRLEDANDTISSKPYALPQLSSTSNLLAAVPHTSSSKCLSQAAGQLSFADPTLQLDQSEIDSFFSALGNPPVEVDFAAVTQLGLGPEDANATVCTNPSSLPQSSGTATFPLVPITSQVAPKYPGQTFADYHPLLAAPIPALSLQDLDGILSFSQDPSVDASFLPATSPSLQAEVRNISDPQDLSAFLKLWSMPTSQPFPCSKFSSLDGCTTWFREFEKGRWEAYNWQSRALIEGECAYGPFRLLNWLKTKDHVHSNDAGMFSPSYLPAMEVWIRPTDNEHQYELLSFKPLGKSQPFILEACL
ncbi:hypothetical protein BT69DRAFT_1354333 [Atractiella rhizophila]|nr:hypothetical protein BT69DRAFT_1354333 [Atractiella rhizophila]